MRRVLAGLVLGTLAAVGAGCALTDPQPVYHPAATRQTGERLLVVGLEREAANRPTVEALARELAFGLARRGRAAQDFATFAAGLELAGRPLPAALQERLQGGLVDGDVSGWLQAEGIRTLILLEVPLYEQVWGVSSKRTRVGLSARGRDLANGEAAWHAYTTPEVEDEPGLGFQHATAAALGALARAIVGEPQPAAVPAPVAPLLRGMW